MSKLSPEINEQVPAYSCCWLSSTPPLQSRSRRHWIRSAAESIWGKVLRLIHLLCSFRGWSKEIGSYCWPWCWWWSLLLSVFKLSFQFSTLSPPSPSPTIKITLYILNIHVEMPPFQFPTQIPILISTLLFEFTIKNKWVSHSWLLPKCKSIFYHDFFMHIFVVFRDEEQIVVVTVIFLPITEEVGTFFYFGLL